MSRGCPAGRKSISEDLLKEIRYDLSLNAKTIGKLEGELNSDHELISKMGKKVRVLLPARRVLRRSVFHLGDR